MATQQEVDRHLKMALDEIGKIEPWWDKEVNEWIFSHHLYPVEYGGKSAKEVIENYPKYLRELIKHRLNNKVENLVEQKTIGRGGKRLGAGRPRGTKTPEGTKTIRVKAYVAKWIKEKENEREIEDVISGAKRIVPVEPPNDNHHLEAR